MKGLLYKNITVLVKSALLGMVVLLVMCIAMEGMNCYVINTSGNGGGDMTPEQEKAFFASFAATIGFLFIYSSRAKIAMQPNNGADSKFNILIRTLPVSAQDIVMSEYITAFAMHILGLIAAAIYFSAGYFMGLFQNPLREYGTTSITLFFVAWLSELVPLPLGFRKTKTIIAFLTELTLLLVPIGVVMVVGALAPEKLSRAMEWLNSHTLVVLISVFAVACVLTPVSAYAAKQLVKKERI